MHELQALEELVHGILLMNILQDVCTDHCKRESQSSAQLSVSNLLNTTEVLTEQRLSFGRLLEETGVCVVVASVSVFTCSTSISTEYNIPSASLENLRGSYFSEFKVLVCSY